MGALTRAEAQSAWAEQTAPTFLQWAKASSLPLRALVLLFSLAHPKHSGKEGSISHLRWGSKNMHWASQPGSSKAEHWKLFFQAEVKSTELCCTATVLGWQYFLTLFFFFVDVAKDLWACIKGYSAWVFKHQRSVEQDISVRMNLCQICAVFFGAQPSKHILLTSHELKAIPMCIPLHYNLPHVNVPKSCLSICVSISYTRSRWHGAALAKDRRNVQGNNVP